jgi:serine/threonine protein kinase
MKKDNFGIKKLKLEDYEIGRILGKGGFGTVRVAKCKKTGKHVALKHLKKEEIIKIQQVDHVHN